MKIKVLLIILCICQLSFRFIDTDREMNPYVESFKEFAETQELLPSVKERLKSVRVVFGTPSFDPNLRGICWYESNQVVIEKKYFMSLNNEDKQNMIDHELGHCVLGRVHNFDVSVFGAASLMYPDVGVPYLFTDAYLRKELFTLSQQGKMPALTSYIFKTTGQTYQATIAVQIMANRLSVAEINKLTGSK